MNFGKITKTEIYWEWPSTTVVTKDEDPTTGKKYQHLYAGFGTPASKTFSIRMLAYSGGVCVDEIIKTIEVIATPNVIFQPIPGICVNDAPRQLTQASEANNIPGTGVYSGTGVTANGIFDPKISGAGLFTIRYTFTANAGCTDTASQTISVWQLPAADFKVDSPVCFNTATTFTAFNSQQTGRVVKWDWTFGDGTTASKTSNAPFQKTYGSVGDFPVTLQVVTDIGCASNVVRKNVHIYPLPQVDFTMPAACANTPAQFLDKSTISDGTQANFKYNWQFTTSGMASTAKDPLVAFPNTNSQTIQLTVTSVAGCVGTATKTLTGILPQPMSNFDAAPLAMCLGGEFSFTDRSNPLNQTITNWRWSFGDDSVAFTQNATHTYRFSGTFDVRHTYTTQQGCNADTVVKKVTVYAYPDVDAGPDIVVVENQSKTIPATVTGSVNNTYNWTPANYLNSTSVLQPVVSPINDLTYILTVTGEGNCVGRDTINVAVALAPIVPNAFSPNGDGINDVWYIKYLEFYPGCTINVFDRYGRLAYRSTGYAKPWDGMVNGKPMPVGIYYYVIDPKNGKPKMSGSLTLLR